MIDDIEDNYPDYLDDERGYAWDAWDVLPADVIRRHDALAEASEAELDELDPAGLDDLDRWAFARASRAAGRTDRFLDAARLILGSGEEHRGLDYADLFVAAIEALATAQLGDEAMLHLRSFRERWPEDPRAARLEVYVAARSGTIGEVLDEMLDEIGDDAELMFEVAEDLVEVDESFASEVLDRVAELAAAQDRRALRLDVELLRDRVTASTAPTE